MLLPPIILFSLYQVLSLPLEQIRLNPESSLLIPLQSHNYTQYSLNISIGTPVQTLSLTLGLQTTWTWLLSSDCSCPNLFNSNSSTSLSPSGRTLSLNYTKGSISAIVSQDRFELKDLILENFNFLRTFKTVKLESLKSSGVLGLGFKSLSNEYSGFLDRVFEAGGIENRVFSIYLAPKGADDESFIVFGGSSVDYQEGKHEIRLSVDNSQGYWKVHGDYVGFDSIYFNIQSDVFIDVGTSIIHGPKKVVSHIKRYFKKRFKCLNRKFTQCVIGESEMSSIPSLNIGLSGESFDISAKQFLSCWQNQCSLLIQSSSKSEWILGIPFLQSYYSSFNSETGTISIYKSNPDSSLLSILAFIILLIPTLSLFFHKMPKPLFTSQFAPKPVSSFSSLSSLSNPSNPSNLSNLSSPFTSTLSTSFSLHSNHNNLAT